MSHIIKGFLTINTMLDGEMNNVAPLGELSPYARTFSTVKTTIAKRTYESVSIEIFSCKEDGIIKNLPIGTEEYLLSRMEDVVDNFVSSLDFADQFTSRYPSDSLTAMGNGVSHDGKTLPSFMEWRTIVDGEPTIFKIWLSDPAFREEYDEFEIRVIPPVPNPNDLSASQSVLMTILAEYDYESRLNAIELARNNDPATKTITIRLTWVDPTNDFSTNLVWTLVVYGNKGLLRDNQLEAVRNYLLRETGKTATQWLPNLPDLVIHTVLTIIPLWDKVALRSSGSVDYVLSPVISSAEIAQKAKVRYGSAGPTSLELSRLVYAVAAYKSIGFLAIPEPNGGQESKFTDLYPDYAIIAINDINLNRLAEKTRSAIMAIEKGIRLAEVDTAGATLPLDHNRITENGITYISYVTNGVTHRVVTKQTYLNLVA